LIISDRWTATICFDVCDLTPVSLGASRGIC
jgi:hypothetical protein